MACIGGAIRSKWNGFSKTFAPVRVMVLTCHGQQRRYFGVFTGFDIVLAAIACIRNQGLHLPKFGCLRLQDAEHRFDLLFVIRGVCQSSHHDQHGVSIDPGLCVVTLLKAPPDTGIMRDASSVRLIWLVSLAAGSGTKGILPRGFLPISFSYFSRLLIFSSNLAFSRA